MKSLKVSMREMLAATAVTVSFSLEQLREAARPVRSANRTTDPESVRSVPRWTRDETFFGWEPEEGHWTLAATDVARPKFIIRTRGQYVHYVRRRVRKESSISKWKWIDGRLLAAGWDKVKPSWLVRHFDRWWSYWQECAERPDTVGSDYNPNVDWAFDQWLRGVPPHHAKALWKWGQPRNRSRSRRKERIMARALSRGSARWRNCPKLGADALLALGKLPPELQQVALENIRTHDYCICEGTCRCALRSRDLPWDIVARYQKMITGDKKGKVLVALALGAGGPDAESDMFEDSTRLKELLSNLHPPKKFAYQRDMVAWLCPAFPNVTLAQARALCLGRSPAQISRGILSKKEAHSWLSSNPEMSPEEWLYRRLRNKHNELPPLRSVNVIRWLEQVDRREAWGQLHRERVAYGPAGQRQTFKFMDRIDEIQDEDLVSGSRTSVEAAFESAAQRLSDEWQERARKDHRVLQSLPRVWKQNMPKCMKHLNTPHLLAEEGKEMDHCVGSYVPAVSRNQCRIFSIRLPRGNHNSTVELDVTWDNSVSVTQHYGAHNEDPPVQCKRVLEKFISRVTRENGYA